MTSIAHVTQTASPGSLVTLFELDYTNVTGGSVLYFTSTAYSNEALRWNGNEYTPVEIEAEGFEYSSQSAFPTPTLRLSNVTQFASSLVIANDDLIGAKVRRIRTFSQYLDNGATPDPLQIFSPDVYNIEQKVKHTRTMVEWKLSAAVDQQGVKIPSYQLVRDYCSHVYRHYDPATATTSYKKATCPYSGAYYTFGNTSTTDPSLDSCPKTLEGCKTRFGANSPLPFKGCPGLGRFR